MNMISYLFFLGGLDAEMFEIRNILIKAGVPFFDHNLIWGAKASSYQAEIDAIPKGVKAVFIELEPDIKLPADSIRIDHHGEAAGFNRKSSLEQVADLLKMDMDRNQRLIAANDRGYLNAMKEEGADKREIIRIRSLDRKLQGVTLEEEKEAKIALKNHRDLGGGAIYAEISHEHVSAVMDRIFLTHLAKKFSKAFIHTASGKMIFSGDGETINQLIDIYRERNQHFWYGGNLPFYGFFGSDISLTTDEMTRLVRIPVSEHMFLFPFRFEPKDNDSSKDFDKMLEEIGWKRAYFNKEKNAWSYNQANYFYPFARQALFPAKNDYQPISRCYKREIGTNSSIRFWIEAKKEKSEYSLALKDIQMWIFDSGTGILSLHLQNYDYNDVEDVLLINDVCRRIYPQFLGETDGILATKSAFFSDRIELRLGAEGKGEKIGKPFLTADFFFPGEDGKKADYIEELIGLSIIRSFNIFPVIDDRMYSICWYGNDTISESLRKPSLDGNPFFHTDSIWYRFLFCDGKFPNCTDSRMMQNQIQDATYTRWAEYGTLFGITRYSFVCITDRSDISIQIIRNHVSRIYMGMALLCLAQRASILKFSNDINWLDLNKIDTIEKFQEKILRFTNRIWFSEVTAQEQGIEMFSLFQQQMQIDRQINELKKRTGELYESINISDQKNKTETITKLTGLGAIFLPFAFVTGFWSMTLYFIQRIAAPHSFAGKPLSKTFMASSLVLFIVSIVISIFFTQHLLKKFPTYLETQKNSLWRLIFSGIKKKSIWISTLIFILLSLVILIPTLSTMTETFITKLIGWLKP